LCYGLFSEKMTVHAITYELTQKDFAEAYTAHRNGRAFSKWCRRVFVAIMLGMVVIVLLESIMTPTAETARSLVPLLVLIAMWVALLWVLPWWTMRKQFLQQPGAKGARTLTLDPAGFALALEWRIRGCGMAELHPLCRGQESNPLLYFASVLQHSPETCAWAGRA
jgi:hypothetical protein